MTLNYRQIPNALRNREPFKGNSMSATIENGAYVIRSYSSIIFTVSDLGNIAEHESRGSKTTSRHRNLCRTYL